MKMNTDDSFRRVRAIFTKSHLQRLSNQNYPSRKWSSPRIYVPCARKLMLPRTIGVPRIL